MIRLVDVLVIFDSCKLNDLMHLVSMTANDEQAIV